LPAVPVPWRFKLLQCDTFGTDWHLTGSGPAVAWFTTPGDPLVAEDDSDDSDYVNDKKKEEDDFDYDFSNDDSEYDGESNEQSA
jgi:hypothetical protein